MRDEGQARLDLKLPANGEDQISERCVALARPTLTDEHQLLPCQRPECQPHRIAVGRDPIPLLDGGNRFVIFRVQENICPARLIVSFQLVSLRQ